MDARARLSREGGLGECRIHISALVYNIQQWQYLGALFAQPLCGYRCVAAQFRKIMPTIKRTLSFPKNAPSMRTLVRPREQPSSTRHSTSVARRMKGTLLIADPEATEGNGGSLVSGGGTARNVSPSQI